MKLVGSRTSPFVRKVRVMLAEKNLACEFVEDNVWSDATTVTAINPLTKVPVLLLDDGTALYDSSVITDYLDPLAAPEFIPGAGVARALVKRNESLGDGIADAGIAIFLERKRTANLQDPGWLARQRGKIDAGIAALAAELGSKTYLRGEELTLGDIACACGLFWMEFRMPEIGWRAQYPNLKAWATRLEARPSFAATRPPA
jgi:glutathione S-transferase